MPCIKHDDISFIQHDHRHLYLHHQLLFHFMLHTTTLSFTCHISRNKYSLVLITKSESINHHLLTLLSEMLKNME